MPPSTPDIGILPTWARWVSAMLGILILSVAIIAFVCPPVRRTVELDPAGNAIKTSVSNADMTSPFLSLFGASMILILFAINGRKFTRISAGDYSAESESPTANATEYYRQGPDQPEELAVSVPDDDAPEPTEPRAGVVTTTEGDLSVYRLLDVPSKVIRDAFSKWPSGEPLPDDLQSFEFATRKNGKGNHPWTIKFRGKKPVVVSYGGRGKSDATVESSL